MPNGSRGMRDSLGFGLLKRGYFENKLNTLAKKRILGRYNRMRMAGLHAL